MALGLTGCIALTQLSPKGTIVLEDKATGIKVSLTLFGNAYILYTKRIPMNGTLDHGQARRRDQSKSAAFI